MKQVTFSLSILLSLLLLAGCASVQHFQYYTLKPLASPASVGMDKSVGVAPVKIPGWMNRLQLTVSDSGFKLDRYAEHRWGEPLEDAVTRVITQNLSLQLSDTSVMAGPWLRSESPDIAVYIELRNLQKDSGQLTLEASWYAIESDQRSTIHSEEISLSLAGNEPEQIVKGFSQLLAELSVVIRGQLAQ